MSSKPIRILFVDDEVRLLKGIERQLKTKKPEWDISLCEDPEQALKLIHQGCFDIVISDMRMPKLDGAALLSLTQMSCPRTIRIILSGHSESEALISAASVAHQYLAKPCDLNRLIEKITQLESTINQVHALGYQDLLLGLSALPSPQNKLDKLNALLSEPEPSFVDVRNLIASDTSLTLKIIQLASTEFFARSSSLSTIDQALYAISLENLRKLVIERALVEVVDSADEKIMTRISEATDSLCAQTLSAGEPFGAKYIASLFIYLQRLIPLSRFAGRNVTQIDGLGVALLLELWGVDQEILSECEQLFRESNFPDLIKQSKGSTHLLNGNLKNIESSQFSNLLSKVRQSQGSQS